MEKIEITRGEYKERLASVAPDTGIYEVTPEVTIEEDDAGDIVVRCEGVTEYWLGEDTEEFRGVSINPFDDAEDIERRVRIVEGMRALLDPNIKLPQVKDPGEKANDPDGPQEVPELTEREISLSAQNNVLRDSLDFAQGLLSGKSEIILKK